MLLVYRWFTKVTLFSVAENEIVVFCPAGMFTFSVLAMLPFTNGVFSKVCNGFYNDLMINGVATSLVGGTFMGLGMTISGSVIF